jgi:predicted nucleotidyltransferase
MNTALLKKRLKPVFKKHKIRKAILFGSFARGDNSSRSDVDLILVKKTRKRFFDRYDSILLELNKAVPEQGVEALIYTDEELETLTERPFIAQALKEGKVLYESK